MTVHCVEVHAGIPADRTVDELRTEYMKFVNRQERRIKDEDHNIYVDGGPDAAPPTNEEYVVGQHRFSTHLGSGKILQYAEDKLQQVVPWYVLRYHGCDHDQPDIDNAGCGGFKTRSWGPVPQEVAP